VGNLDEMSVANFGTYLMGFFLNIVRTPFPGSFLNLASVFLPGQDVGPY
jgi:hypothetical protein